MQLTIAQFTFGLELAGQERVVVDLAKAFQKKGHHSLVCTTQFGGILVQELEKSGIPFKCLGLRKSYDPRALIPVVQYLKENKVDVVITHGNTGCLIPRIAAILTKDPVFIHVEHNVSDQKKLYQIVVNKILSMFTDKIVCVSEKARQSLLDIEKTKFDKVQVIHNGLDTSRFSFIESNDGIYCKNKRIGIVGRFAEQKGHIYFVEAAAKILQSMQNVEFIFVGDGPLRPLITKKVAELGIEKYCHFLGVRSDVTDLLQSFDIFVLSSLWEGHPISLLEAQHFGIAAVVTNVGGVPEVITDGYNGLMVPPKNPEKLAMAIIKLIYNDQLRNNIGSNGKKIINEMFSMEKTVNAYLNLVQTLINNRNKNRKSSRI